MAKTSKGLGKGLNAIIPNYNDAEYAEEARGAEASEPRELELNQIKPNREQPRKSFDIERIEELAQSIRENGLLQPIIVTREENYYRIVAGERRYRACIAAGMEKIPVIIKEMTPQQVLQAALIENLQREDLNAVEEALAYAQLRDQYNMTQQEIADKLGKSRAAIANALRLLSLPNDVVEYIREDRLSAGHARAVLALEDEDARTAFAEKIISDDLSVREAERLSKSFGEEHKEKNSRAHVIKAAYIAKFEEDLSTSLGTRVSIRGRGAKGTIEIEYYSNEDLERLIEKLVTEGEESY